MRNTKQCPKCGSRNILEEKGGLSDNNSIRLSSGVFARLPVIHSICADCGYVEMWVSQEDLHYVRKEKQKRDNRSPFWK